MPLMKAVGMNTAHNTRPTATTAPLTSSIALRVAACGSSPSAILRSTFSTTTMASSTTMPMASTNPNTERLLSEKPIAAIAAKVPINDTGTASNGMMDARQLCRKITTTNDDQQQSASPSTVCSTIAGDRFAW